MTCFRCVIACCIALLAGCGDDAPSNSSSIDPGAQIYWKGQAAAAFGPSAAPQQPGRGLRNTPSGPARPPTPSLPPPAPGLMHLYLYRFSLPFGAVSRSDEFWKPVSEDAIQVSDYELLQRNGLRAGLGQLSDWKHFKEFLDTAGSTFTKTQYFGFDGQDLQIEMRKDVPDQWLFSFEANGMSGRRYEHSENLFYFSFASAPRKKETVRVRLCPAIRSLQRRYAYSDLNQQSEVKFTSVEHLYDVGLSCDIPRGQFLVVAPSLDAVHRYRIGHEFLLTEKDAARYETVFVLVAAQPPSEPSPATAPATRPATTAASHLAG